MKNNISKIPIPVLQRLATYLPFLCEQTLKQYIRSSDIARALGFTASTVRQDFRHLKVTGTAKRGYLVKSLAATIKDVIRPHNTRNVIVVGAGNAGKSIAAHEALQRYGFNVVAVADISKDLIGTMTGRFTISDVRDLPHLVRKNKIDIGIITVPTNAAQKVADHLILSGVRGLLNMAPVHVVTPRFVPVIDVRIVHGLLQLSHLIDSPYCRKKQPGKACGD